MEITLICKLNKFFNISYYMDILEANRMLK